MNKPVTLRYVVMPTIEQLAYALDVDTLDILRLSEPDIHDLQWMLIDEYFATHQ